MQTLQHDARPGVLNETTLTLHKHERGAADLQARCGHTNHVDRDRLRVVGVEQALERYNVTKCGGCFDEAGGY